MHLVEVHTGSVGVLGQTDCTLHLHAAVQLGAEVILHVCAQVDVPMQRHCQLRLYARLLVYAKAHTWRAAAYARQSLTGVTLAVQCRRVSWYTRPVTHDAAQTDLC